MKRYLLTIAMLLISRFLMGAVPLPVTYTVGGTLYGLDYSQNVVLQDNGADNTTLSANGVFTFPTAVANGAPYSVTILTQPINEICSVSHGSGTISNANVTNVEVYCISASPVFPISPVTTLDLGIATNRAQNQLSASINATATDIPVGDASTFSGYPIISIGNEIMKCSAKIGTTFVGCTRGYDNTSAAVHLKGSPVNGNVVASYLNLRDAETIALEKHLYGTGLNIVNYGADPTGTTSSTTAIQATITATNARGGGTIIVPCGTFLLSGNAAELLLFDAPVRFVGAGPSCTKFLIASTVPATTDIFHIKPTTDTYTFWNPWLFSEFSVDAQAGHPARDVFCFDGTGSHYGPNAVEIYHVSMVPSYAGLARSKFNGWGVNITPLSPATGFITNYWIHDSWISGGINFDTNSADTQFVENNHMYSDLNGNNAMVRIDCQTGSSHNLILHNNMNVSAGGAVVIIHGGGVKIRDNQMELGEVLTEANSAIIDIAGVSAGVRTDNAEISGNNINCQNKAGCIGIYLGHAIWSRVNNNYIRGYLGGTAIVISSDAYWSTLDGLTADHSGTDLINNGVQTTFINAQLNTAPRMRLPHIAYAGFLTNNISEWTTSGGNIHSFVDNLAAINTDSLKVWNNITTLNHFSGIATGPSGNTYFVNDTGAVELTKAATNNTFQVWNTITGVPATEPSAYITGSVIEGVLNSNATYQLKNDTGMASFPGVIVGSGSGGPAADILLHLASTTKGFALPRFTYVQMGVYAPSLQGVQVYCQDCDNFTDDAAAVGSSCASTGGKKHGSRAIWQNSKWICAP